MSLGGMLYKISRVMSSLVSLSVIVFVSVVVAELAG